MTDREYPHPRALLEELDADELRDLADDLSRQLASIEIALEARMTAQFFGTRHPLDSRDRAAKIIANSTFVKRDR
ncbi:hypothetical protein [Aurantimonas coralicida]|uniref:hypothetical protein n=1 Tax=Aurantimonas coralicida TaxID=182270 RepID=UPI001D181208|nr:hypothetical protein [Aurantimonas coralicida]MCC4298469.1 hypothetical protein [Aurantimonas coralicida]